MNIVRSAEYAHSLKVHIDRFARTFDSKVSRARALGSLRCPSKRRLIRALEVYFRVFKNFLYVPVYSNQNKNLISSLNRFLLSSFDSKALSSFLSIPLSSFLQVLRTQFL